jgi:transcriptional regulator with XRE-family HTH domain
VTSDEASTLGKRLRALWEARGISLSRLALESGVAKGYVSQLLRGEATNPSLEVVRRIAAALGASVTDLLGEEGEPPRIPDDVPAGLREFVEDARKRGVAVTAEDVEMLRGIRYRGRHPESAQDFALLYEMVRRLVK